MTARSKPIKGGGRPDQYVTSSGKIVHGVTSIIGQFKSSHALLHWAWKMGMDGKDYRKERDGAAGTGKLVHDLVERHLHGEDVVVPPDAQPGFKAFLDWQRERQPVIAWTELPIISDTMEFGGTLDLVEQLPQGGYAYIDIKTSSGLYPDMLFQAAAYDLLFEEKYGEAFKWMSILQLPKLTKKGLTCKTAIEHIVPSWDEEREIFRSLLAAFKLYRTTEEKLEGMKHASR